MTRYPVKTAVRDGVPVRLKECRACHVVKLAGEDSSSEFPINTRRADGLVATWRPECKLCYARKMAEHYARFIDQARARHRRVYRQMMADPERAARRRATDAAAKRRARADPERYARIREVQKAYVARKKAKDPTYFAEMERINYRLKQERKGVAVSRSFTKVLRSTDEQARLPGEPLAAVIDAIALRDGLTVEAVCEELGIPSRRARDWRLGHRAAFNVADRVVTRAGLLWADVWPAELFPEIAERLGYADMAAA